MKLLITNDKQNLYLYVYMSTWEVFQLFILSVKKWTHIAGEHQTMWRYTRNPLTIKIAVDRFCLHLHTAYDIRQTMLKSFSCAYRTTLSLVQTETMKIVSGELCEFSSLELLFSSAKRWNDLATWQKRFQAISHFEYFFIFQHKNQKSWVCDMSNSQMTYEHQRLHFKFTQTSFFSLFSFFDACDLFIVSWIWWGSGLMHGLN